MTTHCEQAPHLPSQSQELTSPVCFLPALSAPRHLLGRPRTPTPSALSHLNKCALQIIRVPAASSSGHPLATLHPAGGPPRHLPAQHANPTPTLHPVPLLPPHSAWADALLPFQHIAQLSPLAAGHIHLPESAGIFHLCQSFELHVPGPGSHSCIHITPRRPHQGCPILLTCSRLQSPEILILSQLLVCMGAGGSSFLSYCGSPGCNAPASSSPSHPLLVPLLPWRPAGPEERAQGRAGQGGGTVTWANTAVAFHGAGHFRCICL